MGEDRRKGDRRMGLEDRRVDSSSIQFQDSRNSNTSNSGSKKTYISLTTFVISIVVLLIITAGAILFVYNNLNNKIDKLNLFDNSEVYNDYYDEDYSVEENLYTDDETDNSNTTDENTTDSDSTVEDDLDTLVTTTN